MEGVAQLKFAITPEQGDKIARWSQDQDADWPRREMGKPYYGAIGGSLTYLFTPTSLGVILKVQHANGAELDVTEYNDW